VLLRRLRLTISVGPPPDVPPNVTPVLAPFILTVAPVPVVTKLFKVVYKYHDTDK
jgi:hypothetical protein